MSGPETTRMRVDVVVVGSGLAGLLAAIMAADAGARVAVVAQGEIGKSSNSWLASGGLAAVTGVDPQDSPELHLADIRRTARGLMFDDIAEIFVREAGEAIRVLEALGAKFHYENGKLGLFPAPGHSRNRSVRCQGGGAVQMMNALIDSARARSVELIDGTAVIEVLKSGDGRASGVLGWKDGQWIAVQAASVVLACGGMGRVFPLTSNHELANGSGYYLALKAGATLTDLEFVQFTPTSLAYPPEIRGVSTGGGLMAQPGVQLINSRGERFMERYDKERMENSTRDVLARAIFREIKEGRGTPHNGVYVDISRTDRAAVAQVSGRFLRATENVGIDPYTECVEVAPDVHFAMGGVVADIDGATGIPGLYAAGEITAGLHGANRLNSNGLTEAAVFGIRAGRAAAAAVQETTLATNEIRIPPRVVRTMVTSDPRRVDGKDPIDLIRIRGRTLSRGAGGGDASQMKEEIRNILVRGAGIERDEASIERALRQHAELGPQIEQTIEAADPDDGFALEAMFVLARLILEASRSRTESRGAHYRTDWPQQNPAWDRHIAFVSEVERDMSERRT